MKQTLWITVGLLLIHTNLKAQDIHFSFAEYNPMILNPALAGANQIKEATLNYRSQWGNLGEPYRTTSAGYSARIRNQKRNASNSIALGVQFINDKGGDPSIVSNGFSLVIADHLRVGDNSTLGVGLMLGLGQRSIRQTEGQWATQYNGSSYDPSLPSGERIDNMEFRYADAGIGMVYSYGRRAGTLAKSEDRAFNAGVSLYHVNRPNYSFFREQEDRLAMRLSLFANGEFALESMDASLLPGVYFHKQGEFTEILLGSYYKFNIMKETRYTGFNKSMALSLGLFGRIGDAGIIKMLLDWDQYSLGYSFDFNTSGLSRYNNGNGAHEILLRFISPFSKPLRSAR